MLAATVYDTVDYPGHPFPDTHPYRLAAVATLFGMDPARPETCRVLEVGCGDGANLVPMAWALPLSRFVGIDLAERPIQRGRAWMDALGIRNLTLDAVDLTAFEDAAGSYDYIIAHGLYSWVPQATRDALMALIARHLAPFGVAFVSYNIYPGCHVRQMLWDVLKFHVEGIEDPQSRIAEALALARMLAHARTDGVKHPLHEEAAALLERDPAYTFHDDLSPYNQPVYFHELVQHAAAHGLQFLSESELGKNGLSGFTPEAIGALQAMDLVTREQYLDFMRGRRFRQTLLCRASVDLDRPPDPARLNRLRVSTSSKLTVKTEGEPADERSTLLQIAFDVLAQAYPQPLTMDELRTAMLQAAPVSVAVPATGPLNELILTAVLNGAVELHDINTAVAVAAGERPIASAIARSQAARGDLVTNLLHRTVRLDDPSAGKLLPLLDGSRTRAQLAEQLPEGMGDDAGTREERVEGHLRALGRLALLKA